MHQTLSWISSCKLECQQQLLSVTQLLNDWQQGHMKCEVFLNTWSRAFSAFSIWNMQCLYILTHREKLQVFFWKYFWVYFYQKYLLLKIRHVNFVLDTISLSLRFSSKMPCLVLGLFVLSSCINIPSCNVNCNSFKHTGPKEIIWPNPWAGSNRAGCSSPSSCGCPHRFWNLRGQPVLMFNCSYDEVLSCYLTGIFLMQLVCHLLLFHCAGLENLAIYFFF